MTPSSAIVFSVFGGLWVVFAILSQRPSHPVLCLIPVAIAGLLVMWSISVVRTLTQLDPDEKRRRDKIIMLATGFEGVAFFVGINVLNNMGIGHQYLPLLAVIVGLHFLPFARYIPDWRYYPLSLTLIVIGTVGAFVPAPDVRAWFVGLTSGLALWIASFVALRVRSAAG